MTEPPVREGRPVSADNARLMAFFEDLEKNQVESLDQGARRIIELTTALIGGMFATIALGEGFPPPYLVGSPPRQALLLLTLVLYVVAMLLALWCIQPRRYERYQNNVTRAWEQYEQLVDFKVVRLRIAGGVFFAGSAALVLLIMAIILAA